jgi:hypothetical protein
MGARNWVGIGLLYRPARIHRLDSLESIPGLRKSLKIRALVKGGDPVDPTSENEILAIRKELYEKFTKDS